MQSKIITQTLVEAIDRRNWTSEVKDFYKARAPRYEATFPDATIRVACEAFDGILWWTDPLLYQRMNVVVCSIKEAESFDKFFDVREGPEIDRAKRDQWLRDNQWRKPNGS